MTLDEINEKYMKESDDADAVKYCDIETPFYDGNQCIKCDTGKYFDLTTQKCIDCDSYDENEMQCIEKQEKPEYINI